MDYDQREAMRLRQNVVLSDMFVSAMYSYYEHHPTGGPLHITLDDYNCDDDHLKFCRSHAMFEGDQAGLVLLNILELLDEPAHREGLIKQVHMGWSGGREHPIAVNFQCWRCRTHCPQPGPFRFYNMITCSKCEQTSSLYNKEEM